MEDERALAGNGEESETVCGGVSGTIAGERDKGTVDVEVWGGKEDIYLV